MTDGPQIRTQVDTVADERSSLREWLDIHRSVLRWKCEGLTPSQMGARPVPTSSLSLHGLVRHMAAVERYWFRNWVAGEPVESLYWTEAEPDADFDHVDTADWADDLAVWDAEVARARDIERAENDLDRVCSLEGRPDHDVRWIMVHMIEEYARHNGHADLIRELVDGATGDGWD